MFFAMNEYTRFLIPSVTLKVSIGFLPGGSSSITDTSRSPYRISESVLGIGVAVITSV